MRANFVGEDVGASECGLIVGEPVTGAWLTGADVIGALVGAVVAAATTTAAGRAAGSIAPDAAVTMHL